MNGFLILQRLIALSKLHNVRILYAVESGSRAWGFPSPNSDWDVRFIYAHPAEWYLSVEERPNVIEQLGPDHIDAVGWDIRKAMRLFRASNPSLMEWLRSPIVYSETAGFASTLRELQNDHFSRAAALHHYRKMAQDNYGQHLAGQSWVELKKYLYVIRSLVSIQQVLNTGTIGHVDFRKDLDDVLPNGSVREAIDRLLADKIKVDRIGSGNRIKVLDDWIDEQFLAMDEQPYPPVPPLLPASTLDPLIHRFVLPS
jgi:hypothetical protein